MVRAVVDTKANDEVSMLGRLLANGAGRLSATVARHLLRLRFGKEDIARMNDLAERNQKGRLSRAEREELDSYVKVGQIVAILQSEARMALRKRS